MRFTNPEIFEGNAAARRVSLTPHKLNMNRSLSAFVVTISLVFALLTPASAQTEITTVPQESSQNLLAKFDLNFPGGTPQELVTAVQKAMGRPLNVIVPTPFAEVKIPSLMMKHVDVGQLFKALALASPRDVQRPNANVPGEFFRTTYAFKTDGKPSDDSVWYFTAELPPAIDLTQRAARFFDLTPYLDQALTVDDITTSIQTGWKMAGNSTGCELSYHKETKLLIVVGNQLQLETVNSALQALMQQVAKAQMEERRNKIVADAQSARPVSNGEESKKSDK